MLLSPVWSQPAFPLDFDIASLDGAIATLELMRPVLPANLLGTPAAVVPAGMAEGLPVGVQVMGAGTPTCAAWPSPRRSSSDSGRSRRSTRWLADRPAPVASPSAIQADRDEDAS